MRSLLTKDLQWIFRRMPRRVVEVLRTYPGQVFLAGGFIRSCVANEPVADLDLFAPTTELAEVVGLKLQGTSRWVSRNATTIRWADLPFPVQIIHRWTYVKPEELIESFDFTVAKSVVWFDGASWQSLVHDDFYADLVAKRLVYTKPQRNEDAGGSLLRVLKFYQKGYRIPLDSMAAVVARLLMGVREEDLGGLDRDRETALAMALTGLLHEVDPLQDPQHLFHLPAESLEVETTTKAS